MYRVCLFVAKEMCVNVMSSGPAEPAALSTTAGLAITFHGLWLKAVPSLDKCHLIKDSQE